MLSNAARHLAKANGLQADADDVLREAMAFVAAGEVDESGLPPGDNAEHARLMVIHARLVERARKHTEKARKILDRV